MKLLKNLTKSMDSIFLFLSNRSSYILLIDEYIQ